MSIDKPDIGEADWGGVLNAALDELDARETVGGAQAKATAAYVAATEYTDTAISEIELTPGPQGDPGYPGAASTVPGPPGADGIDGVDGTDGSDATVNDANVAAVINSALTAAEIDARIATGLADKAPIASPTFTGTVSGITKTMVGLGSVDNTSDASKPVSTAQATADTAATTAAQATSAQRASNLSDLANAATARTNLGLGSVDNTSDASKPVSTATQTALNDKEDAANKGAPNGYAPLDPDGYLPFDSLPATVMSFRGDWNASTNTPTLATGDPAAWVHRVTTAGTRDLGEGSVAYVVGDLLVSDGSYWKRVQHISSVAGLAGVISAAGLKTALTLVKGDVGLSNVDNTSNATERAAVATLTNKRITKRVSTTADTATLTITSDDHDVAHVTALAQAMTIAAPTGTPTSAQGLVIRIKDNGSARALTWNAAFRAVGATLPTTTVISKTVYVGAMWNVADSKWDVIAVAQEA